MSSRGRKENQKRIHAKWFVIRNLFVKQKWVIGKSEPNQSQEKKD
jgi:hypothetical protein